MKSLVEDARMVQSEVEAHVYPQDDNGKINTMN